MLTETIQSRPLPLTPKDNEHTEKEYLFHPIADFLCLGGGSLIAFILIAIFIPLQSSIPAVSVITLTLANVINHPHFAHSYQIFYENYWIKISQSNPSKTLRIRYFIAGLLVPIFLLAFFGTSILTNDVQTLSYGMNIMLFLVGWHYVKQGYGMLIVDSVLKRKFFLDSEKKILLQNAYACWIFFWLLTNSTIAEQNIWGLKSAAFSFPLTALYAGGLVATVTTGLTLFMLVSKCIVKKSPVPVMGLSLISRQCIYGWPLDLILYFCSSFPYFIHCNTSSLFGATSTTKSIVRA